VEYKNILLEKGDGLAIVTVNRPKVLNAFNIETVKELGQVFDEIEADETVSAVIITGAGEKSFVAGADINELVPLNTLEAKEFAERGQSVMSKIENFPKPVIAAINGFALGGGCELALACHIRIASKNAKLGLPEVTLGIIPGYGGTQRLPKIVGKGIALELILTGKMINSDEAYRIGLVNRVVEQSELLEEAKKLARDIMKNGPVAVRCALESVNLGCETTIERGLKHEAQFFGLVCSTEDKVEGTKAFLEKRKPEFKNK